MKHQTEGLILTSQVLAGGPGWKCPLDFFDSIGQNLRHLGNLGLADPGCGSEDVCVLEVERQRETVGGE